EWRIWHVYNNGEEELESSHTEGPLLSLSPYDETDDTTIKQVTCPWTETGNIGKRRIELEVITDSLVPDINRDNNIKDACVVVDLDGDNDVDIADIMVVAGRWGSSSSDSDYEPQYDLDDNGDINIVDIMLVAIKWGLQCP
ncbi:MAG: hypothetical protein KKG21_00115, partial [Candidatus Omnitrophica bacterium]|nr:hypothetical protein [Candidatus Omnitrophota bacterium]